ncbi:MAG: hypothetical protein IKN55_05235 [Oscillospiraceae bacterium]|nr:hypothetical protein [Oscillospiraceae bacterium]
MAANGENHPGKTKSKKPLVIVLIILLVLLGGAVWYFQFGDGYLMTIPIRPGYTKIMDNVYVNKDYAGDRNEIIALVNEAKVRDTAFFGEMKGLDNWLLIVHDDPDLVRKVGEKDTKTLLFPKKEYTGILREYLNVDIVAHEMTHAELHSHFHSANSQRKMPTWFDEGIATQNDYREQYSAENWAKQTDNGKNATPLEDMDTGKEFYAGEAEDRRFRYMCAKHEVAAWIEAHSVQELLALADKVDAGEDFYTLYRQ